jgi:hypothetical protein
MSFEGLRNLATTMRIYQRNKQDRKWEPEAPYMKEVVKPGDICLHFGGSDGRHSYLLSQHIGPKGVVHVYEPSNYSYAIMTRLLRWHKLKNVIPHNAAIGSAEGSMILSVPKKMSGHLGRAYGVVTDRGGTASDEMLATGNRTEFVTRVQMPAAVLGIPAHPAEFQGGQLSFMPTRIFGRFFGVLTFQRFQRFGVLTFLRFQRFGVLKCLVFRVELKSPFFGRHKSSDPLSLSCGFGP